MDRKGKLSADRGRRQLIILLSRCIVCLLCLLICLSDTDQIYAAAPTLSASADAGSVTKGGYVTISIQLNNNPSLSTLGMALGYDGSVLKYDSTSWSSSFTGEDMKMASDTGSEVNLSVVCADSYLEDGTVASVRFSALADTSSIPVTLQLRDMADAELSAVSCKVTAKVYTPSASVEEPGQDKNSDQNQEETPSITNKKDKNNDQNQNKTDKDQKEQEEPAVSEPVQAAVGQNSEETGTGVSQVTVNTQTNQMQQTAVKNTVQQVMAANSRSEEADDNYKTGAGIGNDWFLVFAAVCGIAVFVLLIGKAKREEG